MFDIVNYFESNLLKNKIKYTYIQIVLKGAFTHPVSACVFRITLQFFITYISKIKVSYKKNCNAMLLHAETGCVNSALQHIGTIKVVYNNLNQGIKMWYARVD